MGTDTYPHSGPSLPLRTSRWEMAYRIALTAGAVVAICVEFAVSPIPFALFTLAAYAVAATATACIAWLNATPAAVKIAAWTVTLAGAAGLCYWAEHLRPPGTLMLVVAILGVGAAAMAMSAGLDGDR